MTRLSNRGGTQTPVGAQREEQILKAAAKVFRQYGYHAASIQSIADASGLGKSSLYHHISNKQELLGTIVDRGVSKVVAAISSVVESDATPTEKLRSAIEQHTAVLTEWLDGAAVAIQERRSLTHDHLENYIGKRDRYEKLFCKIIEQGIEAGEFRPVNVKFTNIAILQMLNGIVYWFNPAGPLAPEQFAANFFDLAYAMLKRPEKD